MKCFLFRNILLETIIFIATIQARTVFNTTELQLKKNFSCYNRSMGFYADLDTNCKIYYMCDENGNKFTYHCPEETAFRQDALICDHARLVICRTNSQIINRTEDNDKLSINKFNNDFLPESYNGREAYSRSFHIIQPDKFQSSSNKVQPGFVFRASMFFRDQGTTKSPIFEDTQLPNFVKDENSFVSNLNHRTFHALQVAPTVKGSHINRFNQKPNIVSQRNDYQDREAPDFQGRRAEAKKTNNFFANRTRAFTSRKSFDTDNSSVNSTEFNPIFPSIQTSGRESSSVMKVLSPGTLQRAENNIDSSRLLKSAPQSPFSTNIRRTNDPYQETLRSIQDNAKVNHVQRSLIGRPNTTEFPQNSFTIPLKSLSPNESENDPYYPKLPTSTETYYTPNQISGEFFRSSTEKPWDGIHFELPSVLPNLNSLDDLVDRRKLFYIPRIRTI